MRTRVGDKRWARGRGQNPTLAPSDEPLAFAGVGAAPAVATPLGAAYLARDPSPPKRDIANAAQHLMSRLSTTLPAAPGPLRGMSETIFRTGRATRQLLARGRPRDLGFTLRFAGDRLIFDAVGEAFARKLGLRPRDLLGRDVAEVLPPAFSLRLAPAAAACATRGRAVRWMQPVPLQAGRLLWRFALLPVRGPGGRVRAVHGLIREVADETEARMGSPQRADEGPSAPPPHLFRLVGTSNGDLISISPEYAAYAGLPPDATQEELLSAMHPNDLMRTKLLQEVGSPCTLVFSIRLRRKDGVYRMFRLTSDFVQGLVGDRWYGAMVEVEGESSWGETKDHASSWRIHEPALPSCSVELDRDWRITDISRDAMEHFRMRPREVIGADAREKLLMRRGLREAVQTAFETGRGAVVDAPSLLRPSRWLECRVQGTPGGVRVLFEDVTERRIAQRAMDPPEQLRGFNDATTAQMLLLDESGVILSVNEAYRASLGSFPKCDGQGPFGYDYPRICRFATPEIDPQVIQVAIENMVSGRIRRFVHTFARSVGEELSILRVRITPLQLGAATRLIVLHEDLTDLARTEAALRDATEQLLKAQQEERQRIAIELHDSTSQHLAAVGLGMAKLRRIIGARSQAKEVIDDVSYSLQEAIKEIRVLSYLMKPAALERNGLAATAEVFVKGFGRRTGLNTSFRAEGAIDAVSKPVAHACFRVIQEALSNVYRHAEAKGVEVELANRDEALTIRIADDGKGIGALGSGCDEARIGVGITGMRVRVGQLGGELDISWDGAGTVVLARLPANAETSEPGGASLH